MAESAPSAAVSATPMNPAPAVPTGLVATPGNASVGLNWNASSGAVAYYIWQGTSAGSLTKGPSTASTSYNVTGLTNGQQYFFAVSAVSS